MKEKILSLRAKGFSYREIQEILGCSKGTIAYHCGEGQKEKNLARQKTHRAENSVSRKVSRFKEPSKEVVATSSTISDNTKQRNHAYKFQMDYETKKLKSDWSYKDLVEKHGDTTECYLTGDPVSFAEPRSYSLDHKMPRSRGGDNSLDNVGVCTLESNHAKRDMTEEEFVELCVKVVKHHGYSVILSEEIA